MRFRKYLKEDIVDQALKIVEPTKGLDMSIEEMEGIIETLNSAIEKIKDKVKEVPKTSQEELDKAKYQDLFDKIVKWQEVVKKLSEPEKEPAPEEEE